MLLIPVVDKTDSVHIHICLQRKDIKRQSIIKKKKELVMLWVI